MIFSSDNEKNNLKLVYKNKKFEKVFEKESEIENNSDVSILES